MQHDKLTQALCLLLAHQPWYGHAAAVITWIESETVQTMGVRIMRHGEIECVYNPAFVEELNLYELCFVIQHEIEHLCRNHCVRLAGENPVLRNIACDMVVNGQKAAPRIGLVDPHSGELVVPYRDELCWIPAHWPPDEPAESYYNWLAAQVPPGIPGGGRTLDDHSTWAEGDAEMADVRAVAQHVAAVATEASQGQCPGHLRRIIEQLGQTTVPWEVLLRRYVGDALGQREISHARRNRRRDIFGLPGHRRSRGKRATVVVDVSGSVSKKRLGRFFSEIESICSSATVSVLLWDDAFQGYFPAYKPGQWRKIACKGCGGTNMIAPLQWLVQHRRAGDVVVMLTDGYCSWGTSPCPFPFIAAICTDMPGPTWGRTVRLTKCPRSAVRIVCSKTSKFATV